MKKQLLNSLMIAGVIGIFAVASPVMAQTGYGYGQGVMEFVDENGDGFNDLAPDADGDGIPNAYDEDYVAPADGSGNKYGAADHEIKGNGPGDGTGLGDKQGWGGKGPHNSFGVGDEAGDYVADPSVTVTRGRLLRNQK